ncbi:hypothetical protein GA0070622_6419 [Micromonospora sediminicola]|uniref:Uncharacterized protein n=1 Tax=Micromonospora sediminicola TaxID=946078 RepID=A0A1A9BIF9_9ACTN|nr:hypothetical protein [Micromonospora sediminicola]SBT69295.1 hypothetical protein GA0070622_6419 [Micromonospora sediminicola]
MIFFDVLVYLAVAKIAVLLFEDAAYAVRGKQSPRRQARARQQAAAQKATADGSAGASASAGPGRAGGGAVAAADGYLAGLIEDATEKARARRRRALARKRGAQAVDGVVTDVDDDGRWYADCDLCGWASRPYRIEANAQGAGREHTRTEHPEQYTGAEPAPAADTDSAESAATPTDGEQGPRRPALRVIPGGAQDATDPAPVAAAGEPAGGDRGESAPGVVHTDQHPYCLTPCGPTCTAPRLRPRFGWRCGRCGERSEGFASFEAAEEASVGHRCATDSASDADTTSTGGDAGDEQHHPAADPATGTTSSTTERLRELTVNLEATGPEEIRAAFTQAAESAGEQAEQIGGIAGVLTEAADRYEGLEMAASTVGHLRDAAEQFAAAHAALNSAQEELQAALGDFNSKDGQVADVVADAGGNVASKEVLVG